MNFEPPTSKQVERCKPETYIDAEEVEPLPLRPPNCDMKVCRSDRRRPSQNLFYIVCFIIPRSDLRLVVQNHVQQGIVDLDFSIVFDKAQFAKSVQKKLTRDRVVPIISASIS
jgi:hypothetical protein